MGTHDDPMTAATVALKNLMTWVRERVMPVAQSAHPAELKRWQQEMHSISQTIVRPQTVQVALVGTTGAGKSTLLNALLGVQLLQVGVAQSITSFVTLVRFSDAGDYRIEIEYASRDEWAEEVERFINASLPGDTEGDGEAKSIVNNLRRRVEAVYAISVNDLADIDDLRRRSAAPETERIFAANAREVHSFDDTKAMVQYLRSVVRAESPAWPLVKQVTISGPFDALRGGIELVDLPGTNDLNDARVDVTREFIRNAPFVWLVFSMKRGITADGRELLEREKVLRTLVLSGSYHSLQLIGTHADDVDWSVADQFGLDEDVHTDADLIAAYRKHFVDTARPVLLEVVDNLANAGDDAATLERMRDLARNAPIHAVSARAYNQIKGIVRSNASLGLQDDEATGIPGVVRALRHVADEVGGGLTARTVLQRTRQLQSEIASFFRARAAAGNPVVARAKESLEIEVKRLGDRTASQLAVAGTQLEERRHAFLGRIQPLLTSSVQGVTRTAQEWQQIHWGTLRAIVNRDGVFKSPSSGRLYDLNEQVVDPLLNNLPVAWEGYFTNELGAVRDRLAQRVEDFAVDFIGRARELTRELGGRSLDLLGLQLQTFRDRVAFERQQCELNVAQRVGEIRRQAANGMASTAKDRMVPAYEHAADERGPGMKGRMLAHIQPAARSAANPIFDTIQRDLVERLVELESIVSGLFGALERACIDQAELVAQNINLDIDEARVTPEVRTLLAEQPELTGHPVPTPA